MKMLLPLASVLAMCAAPAIANDTANPDHHKMMADAMFKKIDTNGDGSISKDEMDAFSTKMFREADTNGDGKVSKDEFMAHKMKEKEEMKTSMGDKVKTSDDAKSTTNSSATMEK